MPLRMKSFRIEGFKAIGDATLHWHPRVNVITGPNNSGKTTVLEALALWVESFDRIAGQAGRSVTKRGVKRGDWYLDVSQVHHSEVVSVRSPGFDDLFHREVDRLTLTATLEDQDGDFAVPLHIRKARGGHYDFQCLSDEPELNRRLNTSLMKWPHPFRVLFASPVAAVLTDEEFRTPGKIADMIRPRRSAEVLRNRIYRLYNDPTKFQLFKDDVNRVLTAGSQDIQFEVGGDPATDVRVRVLARSTPRDRFRDISLLGSGSLQIIEVLLNLYLDPSDLDLVLLDEPDSHIHRDIQRRLLAVIEEKAERAQVFATTHNESMLRNAGWDRVFHLAPAPADAPREFRPVVSTQLVVTGRQHGLIASPLRNVLSSVGAETALDFLNALEAQLFLLVEGASDAVLFDRMLDVSQIGGRRDTAMYWSLNGIDGGLRSLPALRVILQNIRNDRSLWDKAHLILDRDLLTEQHAEAIRAALERKFGLRADFWAARTVEAVLLSGGPSAPLARLLTRVGTTSHLPNLADDAEQACIRAWTALGSRLKEKWDQPNLETLHGMLVQRLELLHEVFPKNNPVERNVGKLQQSVCEFHRAAIDGERYWDTADKEDVAFFISEVFQHMNVSREDAERWRTGPNWYQAVVCEIKSVQDFPALQSMRESLRRT